MRCIDILKENLFTSAVEMGFENNFIFQQDNDTKYKAQIIVKLFEENNSNKLLACTIVFGPTPIAYE
ncbi:hypothetical protein WH47_06924 [Habropoda laboriosa]|uniref:Uncharacterized protein n=1 Tax=Habropoda laboriosa TaxID=597456 RepID=A0A0L7QQ65_9HYME|nr:hypothetical protein WH47_06924 [Habropoda laboriosa]